MTNRINNPVQGIIKHYAGCRGAKAFVGAPRFTAAQALEYAHKVTVPVGLGGKIGVSFLEQLAVIGKSLTTP
jgi:hypothetical protein